MEALSSPVTFDQEAKVAPHYYVEPPKQANKQKMNHVKQSQKNRTNIFDPL